MSRYTVPGRCALLVAFASLSAAALAQTGSPAPPSSSDSSSSATTTTTTQTSNQPETHRLRFHGGPQIGTYLPVSAKTRDRFGGAWLEFGIGVGRASEIHPDHHFSFDLSILSNSRSGEKAFLVLTGASYAISLGDPKGRNVPFAGLTADAVGADLRSDKDNQPSRTRFTGGGAAFIGERFGESGYVEARYNAIVPVRGFDLSGVNLTLGLRF